MHLIVHFISPLSHHLPVTSAFHLPTFECVENVPGKLARRELVALLA